MFIVACRTLGGLSVGLYVISLPMTAFVTENISYVGFGALFDGILGVLFASGVNWPWFANPALFVAWLFLLFRAATTAAAIFSGAALVAAVYFFAFPRVMNNEGGVVVRVSSLELGYWLWLASIVLALVAAAARLQFNAARRVKTVRPHA